MKKEQPTSIAFLEELMIFLAIVGISAILWAVESNRGDFWREVSKATLLGYVIRILAGAVTRPGGKSWFRLTPQERAD